MKSIYVRNLFKFFLRKKRIVIVAWVVIVVIFGGIGVLKAYPEKLDSSVAEENAAYESALQNYDDAISEVQENITYTQGMLENQQEYVDNSVLMQMDAQNVQKVNVQYAISLPETSDETTTQSVSNILAAWTTYIKNGSCLPDVSEELGTITSEYLAELVSADTSGNVLSITVKHSDMDEAKRILQSLQTRLEGHRPEIEDVYGTFGMSVLDSSEQSLFDTSVQSTQNSKLGTLRDYTNNLADYQTKLVSLQTQKETYIEGNKPETVTSSSPKKIIVEYGALGVIAGVVIPFLICALAYTISGRIKGKEELMAADLNVLAVFRQKKGEIPVFSRAALDVSLLAKKSGKESVGICRLGGSACLEQMNTAMTSALDEQKIGTMSVQAGQENAKELEQLASAGAVILLVEAGETTYAQLEEQLQFCRRFDISVWGCVFAE